MKKFALLFFSLSFYHLAIAQSSVRVDPQKDRMQVEEYTIVLRDAVHITYGYDIGKGAKIVIEQKDNPIIPMTKGLITKQDAFNLAQWVISILKETGELPKSYPSSLFEELKLTREK